MHAFRLTKIALALSCLSLSVIAQEENADKIEKISVYGHHNRLILDSGTATKSNMDLLEIPAAITVIGKELIEQQGVTDLQDIIRNVSGLSQAGNNYGIGDNLVIRGLGVNYTYDGMYAGADLGNSYNPTRSMTNIESIEVLKGPSTGLYGVGSAGGVINLVEKKAKFDESYNIKANVGQWNTQQIMFDATGALTNKLAYRFVVNHETSDGYRQLGKKRTELFSSLLLNTHENHALTLSATYSDDSIQIDSVGDPVRILNHASIQGEVTNWQALVNDFDGDNDGSIGIQLTNEQRQELANSIRTTDGNKPYNLDDGNLISPLSTPNESEALRVKLKSEWEINSDLHLTQQLQYRDYSSEYSRQTGAYNYVYWNRRGEINANPRAPLVLENKLYPFAARRQEYRHQISDEQSLQYFADLQLNWQFHDVEGEHLISLNYQDRDIKLKSSSIYDADGTKAENAIPYILDIRTPNWPSGSFDDYAPVLRSNYNKSITSAGISFQEVLYFNDALTGRFGAAYTTVDQTYQHLGTVRSPLATEEADTDDKGSTYNLGLNYRFIPTLAGFINVSKGLTAYSILGSVSATQLDNRPDSTSKSIDVGVRFTALSEELIGSFVWFDTKRTNLRYNNPFFNDNPDDDEFNIDVPQYYYNDEDKTRGYEFDINLDVNESLTMNINATYQDAELIRNQNRGTATPISGPVKGIPEKLASFWAEYRLNANGLPGLFSFNLGLTYEDKRTINSVSFGLPVSVIDSYTVWDGAIKYDHNNWNIRLNVNNIFDKKYYSKPMFLGGLPGNSRNAKLAFNYNF